MGSHFLLLATILGSVLFILSLQSHFLKALLTLEGISLLVVSGALVGGKSLASDLLVYFFIFVMFVAEASLGLGVLIQLSRKTGSQMMTSCAPA